MEAPVATMLQTNVNLEDYNGALITVPMFQLVQWKHAIALEIAGKRNSRGNVRAHVRRVLSAPVAYSDRELHAYISGTIAYVERALNAL